jgi:hypothetical protein
LEAKRFVVLAANLGKFRLIRTEFGIVSGYIAREFDQRDEAEDFTDSAEAKLGPLKILDRETNQIVYVSRTGRFAGSLTGDRRN